MAIFFAEQILLLFLTLGNVLTHIARLSITRYSQNTTYNSKVHSMPLEHHKIALTCYYSTTSLGQNIFKTSYTYNTVVRVMTSRILIIWSESAKLVLYSH